MSKQQTKSACAHADANEKVASSEENLKKKPKKVKVELAAPHLSRLAVDIWTSNRKWLSIAANMVISAKAFLDRRRLIDGDRRCFSPSNIFLTCCDCEIARFHTQMSFLCSFLNVSPIHGGLLA